MTDTSRPGDDTAALRAAIAGLAARLDRIEAQGAQPSVIAGAQARLTGAWDALRGSIPQPADGASASPRRSLLWPVLTVCAILLALILAAELAEEVLDGLWHLSRWID